MAYPRTIIVVDSNKDIYLTYLKGFNNGILKVNKSTNKVDTFITKCCLTNLTVDIDGGLWCASNYFPEVDSLDPSTTYNYLFKCNVTERQLDTVLFKVNYNNFGGGNISIIRDNIDHYLELFVYYSFNSYIALNNFHSIEESIITPDFSTRLKAFRVNKQHRIFALYFNTKDGSYFIKHSPGRASSSLREYKQLPDDFTISSNTGYNYKHIGFSNDDIPLLCNGLTASIFKINKYWSPKEVYKSDSGWYATDIFWREDQYFVTELPLNDSTTQNCAVSVLNEHFQKIKRFHIDLKSMIVTTSMFTPSLSFGDRLTEYNLLYIALAFIIGTIILFLIISEIKKA